MNATRREALLTALFGAGHIGLRALATGLPASVLLNPRRASAATCTGVQSPQYLIWATSYLGDPLNGNVPGTYDDPNIVHPPGATMAPTPMNIGGTTYTAALPWASLPPETVQRTCFFHHSTLNPSHANEPKVLGLMGAVRRGEMAMSLVAKNLAPCLRTVQAGPIAVGALSPLEFPNFGGRVMPTLPPTSLKSVLLGPTSPLQQLRAQRDADLNELNALYKQHGTAAQRAFLDSMAQSQTDLRALSDTILNGLASITSNNTDGQITAAILLIQMNITPVVTIHIPWGGDNHTDVGLVNEAAQTVAGVASVQSLQTRLAAVGLQDKVTFACMNVFGRTMNVARKGTNGRDHQPHHHCSLIIGKGVRGSVIGGVTPQSGDFVAQAIDSRTGRGVNGGGDIPLTETLGAVGKTLCAAVGLGPEIYNDQITVGKAVTAALA